MDFGILLGLAYNQFVSELHDRLGELGFTHLKPAFGFAFKVLMVESLTTSGLAVKLGVTPQGAAKTVEEMVAAGFVERVPDPADARSRLLVLTPRARALVAAGHEFHQEFEERLAGSLGAEKVDALREVLDAIVERSDSPDGLARTLRQL